MMMKMKGICTIHRVAWVLVVIGALNWGLIGVFRYNLVMSLLDSWPMVERIVYILVGIAGVAMLGIGKCCMRNCKCGDDVCAHCGMEEKKPVMGVPPIAGERKM